MDNRVLLAIALSFGVLILFQYLYFKYFAPPPLKQENITQSANQIPPKEATTLPSLPKGSPSEKFWEIKTPFIQAKLTNLGVRFTEFKLLSYFQGLKNQKPIELVSAPKEAFPLEIYTMNNPQLAVTNYEGPTFEKLELSSKERKELSFVGAVSDLKMEKKLIFKGNSYYLDLEVALNNLSNQTIKDRLIIRGVFTPFSNGSSYVFRGPFYYTNHLEEVKLKDTLSEYIGSLKYLGYMDVYFLVALIPKEDGNFRATFRKISEDIDEFIFWSDEFTLNPNEKKTFNFKIYLGPKKTEDLKKEYPLLTKSLYFGIFDFVAKPLLYLLKFFNQFTHNYGWAIVIITFLIRILFYPLNHMSFKSMKKMQELQPVFQKLREKYKEDPQTFQRELMNLYKTHKINPFSGCLPILIQIPVFIAFYKVLLMAIELRHASFILWINDLSAPERLYLGFLNIPWLGGIPVLTILMGISMFIQQKLTPTSMDPTQEKLMLILPIFFTVLFINFPSGLVLYWFVNNILSIIQQLITFKFFKKT